MKKVFLNAYDKINLGDDLFIYSITKRYPDVQFYMWSDIGNRVIFSSLPNLKVINKDSKWLKLLGAIRKSLPARYKASIEKKCVAVIYIGGSLFIEYENWGQILNWWEYQAENRPFYIIGANFGPYKSEEYRAKLDEIFAKTKDVCFRDMFSYLKFENNEKVRHAEDILFGYQMPKVETVKKQVFISAIDLESKDEGLNKFSKHENAYIKVLLNTIEKYAEQGYQVVLSSFCKHEGDEKAVQKLLGLLCENSMDKVKVLNYDGKNAEEVLTTIAESEFVIGSRFHAVILAMVAERPVIPVIYSDKTIHVLEDIEFKGECIDIRKLTGEEQLQKPVELLTGRSIQELRDSSKKHFEKIDLILKE